MYYSSASVISTSPYTAPLPRGGYAWPACLQQEVTPRPAHPVVPHAVLGQRIPGICRQDALVQLLHILPAVAMVHHAVLTQLLTFLSWPVLQAGCPGAGGAGPDTLPWSTRRHTSRVRVTHAPGAFRATCRGMCLCNTGGFGVSQGVVRYGCPPAPTSVVACCSHPQQPHMPMVFEHGCTVASAQSMPAESPPCALVLYPRQYRTYSCPSAGGGASAAQRRSFRSRRRARLRASPRALLPRGVLLRGRL